MSEQPDEQTQQQIKELKQAIVEEEETQSVLRRVLGLLQNKTKRQKKKADQRQIEQLRNCINKSN